VRHFSTRVLATVFLTLLVGCASAPMAHRSWINAKGGLAPVGSHPRVDQAVARLLDGCIGQAVRVQVLDSGELCAYAWPGGEVYLTRGLVELLDDAEIAAAVAHEMGHLLHDGHARNVASLRGRDSRIDMESQADLLGVELLRSKEIPPDGMIRMLNKLLHWGRLSPESQRAVRRRIEILANRKP
jgi:predicted Zn-dependent protease